VAHQHTTVKADGIEQARQDLPRLDMHEVELARQLRRRGAAIAHA